MYIYRHTHTHTHTHLHIQQTGTTASASCCAWWTPRTARGPCSRSTAWRSWRSARCCSPGPRSRRRGALVVACAWCGWICWVYWMGLTLCVCVPTAPLTTHRPPPHHHRPPLYHVRVYIQVPRNVQGLRAQGLREHPGARGRRVRGQVGGCAGWAMRRRGGCCDLVGGSIGRFDPGLACDLLGLRTHRATSNPPRPRTPG